MVFCTYLLIFLHDHLQLSNKAFWSNLILIPYLVIVISESSGETAYYRDRLAGAFAVQVMRTKMCWYPMDFFYNLTYFLPLTSILQCNGDILVK